MCKSKLQLSGLSYKEIMAITFSYNVLDDGSVSITGLSGSIRDRVIVPEEIDGRPVTAIGNSAFMSRTDLSLITLPDTIRG